MKPFLERRAGLATTALAYGIAEVLILVIAAYRESLLPYLGPIYSSYSTYGFGATIQSLAIGVIVSFALLLGYLLVDIRRGLTAFWCSQLFAFLTTPVLMQYAWSTSIGSPDELLTRSTTFEALKPDILFQSITAVGTVLILLIYIGLPGMALIMVGSLFREWKFARGNILVNRRLILTSLMMDGVAVLIPIAPQTGQVGPYYSLSQGGWTLPIMGCLVGFGALLTVVAVTGSWTTSETWSGLLTIGSLTVSVCAAISISFATYVVGLTSGPTHCTLFMTCQEYQDFFNVSLVLYASLISPLIVFFTTTFFTRKPKTLDNSTGRP